MCVDGVATEQATLTTPTLSTVGGGGGTTRTQCKALRQNERDATAAPRTPWCTRLRGPPHLTPSYPHPALPATPRHAHPLVSHCMYGNRRARGGRRRRVCFLVQPRQRSGHPHPPDPVPPASLPPSPLPSRPPPKSAQRRPPDCHWASTSAWAEVYHDGELWWLGGRGGGVSHWVVSTRESGRARAARTDDTGGGGGGHGPSSRWRGRRGIDGEAGGAGRGSGAGGCHPPPPFLVCVHGGVATHTGPPLPRLPQPAGQHPALPPLPRCAAACPVDSVGVECARGTHTRGRRIA